MRLWFCLKKNCQCFSLVLPASRNNVITPNTALLHASVVSRYHQAAVKRVWQHGVSTPGQYSVNSYYSAVTVSTCCKS